MSSMAQTRSGRGDPHAAAADEPVPARSFEEPTPKDKLVSAGLWAAGLSWMVPNLVAQTALFQVVPAHRVNFLGRLYCTGQIALTGNRWRAEVHPDVDPDRPYIFAQNHTNHFDHVLLYNATPHFKQGLELESHFRYPVYGWYMKARGTIPVRKGERGQTGDLLARMRREIDEGRSILAFPEGTRTRTGRVGPFRKGIFYLARDLGVPVVPVAVTGAFDMMRPGSLVIRPGNQITVHCEKPVEMAGASDAEVPVLAERVRAAMAARVDAYWEARRRERG
jgi:1-acyl-sn-glycerol-3-phosphate acyltransferase